MLHPPIQRLRRHSGRTESGCLLLVFLDLTIYIVYFLTTIIMVSYVHYIFKGTS